MMREVHLGFDIGGTASRWVACNASGDVLARGKVAGATGHIFNPAERQRLSNAFSAIAEALSARNLQVVTVAGGMTGYGAAVEVEVKALICEALPITPDRIRLIDDIVLAYLANFAPGEGHLISAGTGSIGVHVAADGVVTRVGGRGILIDDAGSGSWIALQALDQLYRAYDRNGNFDALRPLAECMFKAIGGNTWSDVRQFVYAGDRGRIGTLSVAVAEAALAGDATASDILHRAGDELAGLAAALLIRCGEAPVGLVGGVLDLHPAILERARRSLPGAVIVTNKGDAALSAAQLHANSAWQSVFATGLKVP
jgi:glucosamine kinase